MSNKNIHYKLDFKYKTNEGKTLTFKDFRRRWYWRGNSYDVAMAANIVADYASRNKLKDLVPANFDFKSTATKAELSFTDDEVKQFMPYLEKGREVWYTEFKAASANYSTLRAAYGTGVSYQTLEKFDSILAYLATQTNEFQKYEIAFQEWFSKRPGLREVWNDHNNTTDVPTIVEFAIATNDSSFRNKLENARPRTLKIGTLVQLRDKLKNNRNKDPFYWDMENKDAPRLGMISKFDENHSYGYGSRRLKIMWIANSQETIMMERDLKILSE